MASREILDFSSSIGYNTHDINQRVFCNLSISRTFYSPSNNKNDYLCVWILLVYDCKCSLRNSNETEDEYDFIIQCPVYETTRKRHIKSCYYRNSSDYKLLQLLSTENVKELKEL